MNKKVILISIDGMRPDGFLACGNEYTKSLMEMASYTMEGRACDPAVTLPCHMSMFLSVPPERHGITTNTYTPPVRPVSGLFEVLKASQKRSAMFYGWEELRDVARPGSLEKADFIEAYSDEYTDGILADRAIEYIKAKSPDFVFSLYGGNRRKGRPRRRLDD